MLLSASGFRIDNHPGLIERRAIERNSGKTPDRASAAVAANGERAAYCRLASTIPVRGDAHTALVLRKCSHFKPEQHPHIRKARQAATQMPLKRWLMEPPRASMTIAPVLRSNLCPQRLFAARLQPERHFAEGLAALAYFFGETRGLENSHDLVVEMDGLRGIVNVCIAFYADNAVTGLPKQVCEQRSSRTKPHDDNISVRNCLLSSRHETSTKVECGKVQKGQAEGRVIARVYKSSFLSRSQPYRTFFLGLILNISTKMTI